MHDVVRLRVDFENLKCPEFTGLSDADYINLQSSMAKIQDEVSRYISNKQNVQESLDNAINKYYGSQHGISDSYNSCLPHFNIEERMLMLKGGDSKFYKRNVGSKSNYMFMHLCFFLGLHDYFLQHENAFVPNFLFIDQPSIPYYADMDKLREDIRNDDEDKLKAAFYLINTFMEGNIGYRRCNFQIILIEHADDKYWKKYPYFKTKYRFTKDKDSGLIPDYLHHRL